ncbi:hypothetical protein BDAP_000459 [Binucleata daphniae]
MSEDSQKDSTDSHKPIKKKRFRTVMTFKQLKTLYYYYKINSFPDANLRENIAKSLAMTPRCVQVWFQNQRQKEKNERRNQKTDKEDRDWGGLMLLAQAATLITELEYEEDMRVKKKTY